jgi:NAD(P)-dependent dehydrogenase (short-subunit alcohol dehydrogenase family)
MGTSGRLDGRIAIVIGAGQTPGETMGNGRAASITYGREGAAVLAADIDLDAAQATAAAIRDAGGAAEAMQADATDESAVAAVVATCMERFGRVDVLHNNVGVSLTGGDAVVTEITPEAFDRVTAINLRSMVMACKHVLPVMREQRTGVITNISSLAAIIDYPYIAYQTTKAGVISLTRNVAIANAGYGIRANAILPGLMNTPMAIESRVARGTPRDEVRSERDAQVPLGGRMGTAWDVANAALFLASDEAGFVTGVALPVDGGQALKIG